MKTFYDWCICNGLVLVWAYIYIHGISTGCLFLSRAVLFLLDYISLVSFAQRRAVLVSLLDLACCLEFLMA